MNRSLRWWELLIIGVVFYCVGKVVGGIIGAIILLAGVVFFFMGIAGIFTRKKKKS